MALVGCGPENETARAVERCAQADTSADAAQKVGSWLKTEGSQPLRHDEVVIAVTTADKTIRSIV